MIYVDDEFEYQGRGKMNGAWCHMWSDDGDDELLEFGRKIGLKDSWLQIQNERFHHFDLRPNKRKQALEHGAVYMPLRDFVKSGKQKAKVKTLDEWINQ